MIMIRFSLFAHFFIVALMLIIGSRASAEIVLDVFRFDTVAEARAAWQARASSPAVELYSDAENGEGLRFPLIFGEGNARCYWDRTMSADLSGESVVAMRLYVEEIAPIGYTTLYFQSGPGWYSGSLGGLNPGWQTVRIPIASFTAEGAPLGWGQITGIRFSPWKGAVGETSIVATDLRVYTPAIALVQATYNSDTRSAANNASLIASHLDTLGLDYGRITDEDVEAGYLEGSKIAIFPYNAEMPDTELDAIEAFTGGGGKIIMFYSCPPRVASLLGMNIFSYIQKRMSEMVVAGGVLECDLGNIRQATWNYMRVQPASPGTQVLAHWKDEDGNVLPDPAWILAEKGAYMSHILLEGDSEKKTRLMALLLAHFDDGLRSAITQSATVGIGRLGYYEGYDELVAAIEADALLTPRRAKVEEKLQLAETEKQAATETTDFCDVLAHATVAREHLLDAFFLAQPSKPGEFRGVWNHNGTGPWPGDWERAAENLAENGINAVFPNMLWGGVAHYDSEYLPHSETFDTYGDQIEQCVEACHARGIEVHVWKVNWNLSRAPQWFIDQMRAEGRLQVDANGEEKEWLAPAHPDNYELELNSMVEVATKYNVDGVHFDYIRYSDRTVDYSPIAREKYEEARGITVANWPEDCYIGPLAEDYNDWRVAQITRLVRGVKERLVELGREDVKVSAAVFPSYPDCRRQVGQDWALWVREGYLDFVCPMDYVDSMYTWRSYVTSQLGHVNGAVPVYPGMGQFSLTSTDHARGARQLRMTRDWGTNGWMLFNYDMEMATEVLPKLRKGLTAGQTAGMVFR